ncbi:glycogenin-1-like [Sinocyclocheilus grahami]|uniref:glycogenin-1-like n=1 Tax=Sinocyclocheilus grahami TaxID=75366 RepID=UPI0007AD584F|nr:PREDICTED: glycogenin-1-like [Sinocyclocheilus grahami]
MAAEQAFVSLATNDSYARGAMVLGKSLRNHKTSKKLVVLIGPHVSDQARAVLHKIFDEVRLVDVLDSGDMAHLAMMKRPDLGVTFTKLHCWTLTHYSKCVFMDADTLVVSNIDELFDREELSAAPDPGWPDCFNSGVFVFRPSNETYGKLLQYCTEHGSFDGLYGANAKVVHFLGQMKPWSYTYNPTQRRVRGSSQPVLLQQWWALYSAEVLPMLIREYGDQPFNSGCESEERVQPLVSSAERKQRWEQGQADYMGIDSFDNIQKKLDVFLK